MSALALQSFGFGEQLVRAVDREGAAWFVANDVCAALEISNPRDAVSRLEADERDGVGITDAIGRQQEMTIISESGVYALIFTSRKASAKQFRKWVTQEVLPALRTRGEYRMPANDRGDRVVDLEGVLGTADDRHAIKTALLTIQIYKDLYGQQAGRDMLMKLGFPVPGVDLAPAPTPGAVPRPIEGDLHDWSISAGIKPSRRDATHIGELYDSYVKWCSATGSQPMLAAKFKQAMVMLFNHEEHPEMIRVVMTRG